MYTALYLHIPFCKRRCGYCDFVTEAVAHDDPRMDEHLDTLTTEIRRASREGALGQLSTLYIGGGTPTYLGHKRLVELCYVLSLKINLENVKEYTLEANPESLTEAMVKDLFALGVNRLSLGVQSFVDEELAVLGRVHTAACAQSAFETARLRFENISIDLMCGIPGQTPQSWRYSLERALALAPEHLSIYPLQLEEDTPLWQAVHKGELAIAHEDEQAELLEQAAVLLTSHGYERYEVASYALPGKESLHNTSYWTGASYLGIGRGAASMRNNADGTRARWLYGEESEPELLSVKEAVAEDLMLAMRMSRGVSAEHVASAGQALPHAAACFAELCDLGLTELAESRYRPSEKGWLLGNELFSRIWALAEDDH